MKSWHSILKDSFEVHLQQTGDIRRINTATYSYKSLVREFTTFIKGKWYL